MVCNPPSALISLEEIECYVQLLTKLKADDLISEQQRREALSSLTRVWIDLRKVTGKQSPGTFSNALLPE